MSEISDKIIDYWCNSDFSDAAQFEHMRNITERLVNAGAGMDGSDKEWFVIMDQDFQGTSYQYKIWMEFGEEQARRRVDAMIRRGRTEGNPRVGYRHVTVHTEIIQEL